MDQNKNTPQETYSQPDGIFSGKPDIAYPNTPGFTPKGLCACRRCHTCRHSNRIQRRQAHC